MQSAMEQRPGERQRPFDALPAWVTRWYQSPFIGYGAAIPFSVLTLLIRLLLDPLLGDEAPLLLFVLPVTISAWLGGFGPGLLATCVSLLLGQYFLTPPQGAWSVTSTSDVVRLAIFAFEGVFISTLSALMRTFQAHTRASAQAAQEAVRVRDTFLSIAAHELKTPLATLLGYTFLLERRTRIAQGLAERDQRLVESISNQGQRLHQLIDALLDLSRLEQGRLTLERRPLDLNGLVQRTVAEFGELLEQHTLQLQAADEALPVIGDELRLAQVLHNLLQNAVKYSPGGGPILVRVSGDEHDAILEVSDQGIGIPAAAQGELFRLFYRAQNVDPRQISGLGIGLYLVHEIVTRHAGSVTVTSQEGAGSSFTVRLPLAYAR